MARAGIVSINTYRPLATIRFGFFFFTNPFCQSLRPSSPNDNRARCIELPIRRLKIIYRPFLVTAATCVPGREGAYRVKRVTRRFKTRLERAHARYGRIPFSSAGKTFFVSGTLVYASSYVLFRTNTTIRAAH